MRSCLSLLGCACLLLPLSASPVAAQTGGGVDPAFANAGHFVALVLRPRDALAHPAIAKLGVLERMPELKQQTSFDANKIDEVVLLVGAAVLEGVEPELALVVRFSEPVDQAAVNAAPAYANSTKKQAGAATYYVTANGDAGYLFSGDRTMVFAPAGQIARLAEGARGQGPLVDVLKAADRSHLAQLHIAIVPVRTKLTTLTENAPLPDPFGATIKELPKVVDRLTLTVAKDLSVAWNTALKDNTEAEKFGGMLKLAAALGQTGMDSLIQDAKNNKAPVNIQNALVEGKKALGLLQPQVNGRDVNIKVDGKAVTEQVVPVFAGLLGTVEEARSAAGRAQSMNNLKQILLAMHNYHDAGNAMPAAFTTDKAGKPLLSWRVAILPYIEQDALYKQFKLDEPWDSPHNKQLIAKMPKIYGSPASKVAKDGKTTYLAVRGKNCLLGEKPVKFTHVTDGLSNTVAIVEAADEKAVIWTKPDDFAYDPNQPSAGLGGVWGERFLAGFADGSIQTLPTSTPAETLRRLFDMADGKAIELE